MQIISKIGIIKNDIQMIKNSCKIQISEKKTLPFINGNFFFHRFLTQNHYLLIPHGIYIYIYIYIPIVIYIYMYIC